jgi:hypothetical protein
MLQLHPDDKQKKVIEESIRNIKKIFSNPKDFATSGEILSKNLGDLNLIIIGSILNCFGNLFTNEELAKVISKNTKFTESYVLNVIKKSRDLAFKNNITT